MADLNILQIASLFNIHGWTAVVTGGGTGLGLMTARALAANGVKVYVTGRRLEKLKDAELQHESGGSIIGVQMDVTDKQSIKGAVDHIANTEKHLNFLVNNAGATSVNYGASGMPRGNAEDISKVMFDNQTFDDWTSIYKINVASCYFTTVAFLPLLCAAKDKGFAEVGSVLNISSISGITKESQNGQFSYNASKAACISLTEQLAVDLKEIEVRVNTLAPGYFPSEMTPIDKDAGKDKIHFRERWGIPLGKAGHPRDYAQAVINFAVNQYVTGATLVIDGAWLLAHA